MNSKLRKNLILFFILSLAIELTTWANDKSDKKLIGTALLEFSIFKIDVYQISYYKLADKSEELVLDYKMDIKKEYSVEGWKVGLQHVLKENPKYKEKIEWIKNKAVDLKEGDKFTIKRNKNNVIMLKNGQQLAQVDDKIIASIIFEPWLGAKPVDEDLKRSLLKNI